MTSFGFPYQRAPVLDAKGTVTSWTVDESTRIIANKAGGATRVYPFDQWELPAGLLERAKRLCILKVPLIGQNFGPGGNGWCGRTSSSMMYNWFKLVGSAEPKNEYITQWVGKEGGALDLRLSTGELAFENAAGAFVLQVHLKDMTALDDESRQLLPKLEPKHASARAEEIRRVLGDGDMLIAKFRSCGLLTAIDQRNPAVFCTALAGNAFNQDGLQHIVLVIGYFIIEEGGHDELFIVIADPATPPRDGKLFGMRGPIAPLEPDDSRFIHLLKPEHDYIRLLASGDDWSKARGTVTAIRARAFFHPHPNSPKPGVLLMDHGTRSGGFFFHKKTPTLSVPPELVVETSSSVFLPFDERTAPGSPQRYFFLNERLQSGYYPLGQHQNIHTGVHLVPKQSEGSPPSEDSGVIPVRALAPGYVVALRLPGLRPVDAPQPSEPAAEDGTAGGDASTPAAAPPKDTVEPNELARQLTGSDNGFVLIRHEVAKAGARDDQERRVFYSLYLHLRAPSFDPSVGGFEHDIDWLGRLIQRFGSVTVVDPRSPRFRERRWLAAARPGASALSTGGTYHVYADSLGGVEDLALTPRSEAEVKPLVFVREPELELKETYQRLQRNKVVTFKVPFLRVQAGDIVGVVSRRSNLGKGFLHWEVLTPGQNSMKSGPDAPASSSGLIDFLNGLLPEDARLPADLFKATDESVDDNFFEEDELKSVLDTLPKCDEAQRQQLVPENAGPALRYFMKSRPGDEANQLAFDASLKAKGCFASELRVTNCQDVVPPKSYTLTLGFSGGAFPESRSVTYDGAKGCKVIPVAVPAGSTQVKFKSTADLFVDPGAAELGSAERSRFFKNLVAARWRNALITHLNEWTKAGLKTSIEARLGAGQTLRPEWRPKGQGPSDEDIPVEQYVDAVAWWGENSSPGDAHALFAEPPGPGQLSPTTKVENAHPVTLAWLLRLVEEERVAKLVKPPRWHAEEAAKAAYIGWSPELLGGMKRRVGEALMFIVVQKEEPAEDDEVRLQVQVTCGGKTIPIGEGPFVKGLFATLARGQFWGSAKLGIVGQDSVPALVPSAAPAGAVTAESSNANPPAAAAPASDPLTVTVVAPEVASEELPLVVGRDERARGGLLFTKGCPVQLQGWVVFKSASGKVSSPKTSLPVVAVPSVPWAAGEKVQVEKGVITSCADGVKVSKDVQYGEYKAAAKPNAPQVSVALVRWVQRLRDSAEGRSLSLGKLAADGSSVEVTLKPLVTGDKAFEPMKRLWTFFDRWVDGAKTTMSAMGADLQPVETTEAERASKAPVMKLVDRQDATGGGELEFLFALADALDAAEELAEPKDAVAKLQVGVRFFNGVVPLSAHQALEWSAIGNEACGTAVDVWTKGALEVSLQPHVGKPVFSLVENTNLGRVTVEFLGGDQHFWNVAKPSIKVGPEGLPRGATPEPMKAVPGAGARWQMAYSFPMTVAAFKEKLTFQGVTAYDATFRGKKFGKLSGEELSYDNKTRKVTWLEPAAAEIQKDASHKANLQLSSREALVTLELALSASPANTVIVVCPKQQERADELEVTYSRAVKQVVRGRPLRWVGSLDAEGHFKATLSLLHLREFVEGGSTTLLVRSDDQTDAIAELTIIVPSPEKPPEAPKNQAHVEPNDEVKP